MTRLLAINDWRKLAEDTQESWRAEVRENIEFRVELANILGADRKLGGPIPTRDDVLNLARSCRWKTPPSLAEVAAGFRVSDNRRGTG